MRTIIILGILISLFVSFYSCTSKEEKMKKQYIEACAEGNFSEARKIVEKMGADDKLSYVMDKSWEYVNDKEIYALLEEGTKDASNRILYLYNTYESYQLPDMSDVLDVAISQGNEYLANKLIKGGVSVNKKIIKSAIISDFDELVLLLLQADLSYLGDNEISDYVKESVGEEKHKEMLKNAINHISNQKIVEISINNGYDDIANEMIQSDLSVLENQGICAYIKENGGEGKLIELLREGYAKGSTSNENIVEISIENGYDKLAFEILSKNISLSNKNSKIKSYINKNPQLKAILEKEIKNEKSRKLKEQLNEVRLEAPTMIPIGITETDVSCLEREQNPIISEYNQKIERIIEEALSIGNRSLALEALNCMKPLYQVYHGDSRSPTYHGYKVGYTQFLIWYNRNNIDELRKRIGK